VLDDSYDEARDGNYFKALSAFVCDGLDACGYIHCPGEMMAMTDQWRQPRARWAQYFRKWTAEPEPKALMLTCVFFDLRAIYGKSSLLDDLRRDVLARTQGNRIFLAYMVGNALTHQPPLGLFNRMSTIRSGEHRGTIDLKHTGIVPIVDLARVYALAGGHDAVNTHDRLASAAASHEISEQSARDLRDALEFIATLRIQHQARQLGAGGRRGQLPEAGRTVELRAQPAQGRLRRRADPAERAGPALPGGTLLSRSAARPPANDLLPARVAGCSIRLHFRPGAV
jgi:CBS domain-containing protein